jgi:nicotinate phosphoribosyltransferase
MSQDLSLLLDFYELTMAQGYYFNRRRVFATFDLFVRQMPKNRAYLVACGLEDVLGYLKGLRFSDEDINYLRSKKIFRAEFLKYLEHFRFKGDVWAMPEGTVFFANEPIIRVTASILEAQIVESFLLNTVNLQTMIASKASRVVNIAKGKGLYDFSLRRTHGSEAGLKVARASYVAGFSGTSNVLAGKLYKIPVAGTMAHSFVMTFKRELDAFLAYSRNFPDKAVLLVDTYDTKKGIKNAVAVGLYLKEKGHRLAGIRLDSGDIASLSKFARKVLDRAGLRYVKIFASGNLDEFKIKSLLARGACVDNFGVGTNMGVSIDCPCLDVIYKLSEVSDESGKFNPVMKLSKAKATYPGRKQVFRFCDNKGKFLKDVLGLENERMPGKKLLLKVMEKGKLVYRQSSLEDIRKRSRNEVARLPGQLKKVRVKYKYPVIVSAGLWDLRRSLSRQLEKRQ